MADRPNDLIDVPESGYVPSQAPVANNEGVQASVRPKDLIDVDPDYVSQQINPYNAVTGATTGAAVLAPAIEKKILGEDLRGGRSLETYLRTQRHHDYPGLDLKGLQAEWQKVAGPNARIVTMQDVQEALKATRPVDLSSYKTTPQPTTVAGRAVQPVKKLGEAVEQLNPFLGQGYGSRAFRGVGRAGLGFGAAYEGAQAYNKALEGDVSGAVGSASTGAGLGLMAVPNPVAKGAGAILAGVPLASSLIGSAQATPMTKEEASGTAFDIGTGLLGPAGMALMPSELGQGTLRKRNEVYRPGMNVLKGSTLPPEMAHGGLVHLAEGGEPNNAPFIGYPRIKNKPRDPNFVQQSGPVLGGLDAVLGIGKRDDVSMLTPEGQAYHESYDKYEPVGIAGMVAPFLGGPIKAVGKAAAKHLGPKAADMTENYLAKMGGIQYAVPPSSQSSARTLVEPTAEEIAKFKAKPTTYGKMSDFLQNHMDEYLGLHQSDRLGTHGNYKGGTGFPNFQNIDPLHAKNDVVWMNMTPEASNKIIANNKINGKDVVFSNYIGKSDQHKSNRGVYNEVLADIYKNNPNMTADQAALINARMKTVTGKDLDIRDKFLMQEEGGGTFDARGNLSRMFGEGFGRGKGKLVLSPNYQNILNEAEEQFTKGAPTSAIGTRLHRVYNEPSQFSTAFHPDYDYTVHGKDLGVQFPAVPHTVLDWTQKYIKEGRGGKGSTLPHGNAWFNYMSDPQHINEPFVKRLQSEGFATGGKVLSAIKKMSEEAQAAYKAKFTPGFYHGSPASSIEKFDPKHAASEAGVSTDAAGNKFAEATFLTTDPRFANSFLPAGKAAGYKPGSTVYPVNANLGKHFDYETPEGKAFIKQYLEKKMPTPKNSADMDKWLSDRAAEYNELKNGAWSSIETPSFQDFLRANKYDSFALQEAGRKNVGIFEPQNIRGKFAKFNPEDAADPDFMKAEGGPVQHFQAGGKALSSGLEALLKSIKAADRTPVVPVPNRWFSQPEKFPQVQGMVNKTLENSQLPREAFHSGAFIDPRTGQILDRNIYNDVGVLIDPNTGRPMMSAGKESGIEMLDPKTGSYTKSNLVRQSLFKPTGGDPMLGEMPFIATIEKGGMGHKYALGTEYATPTEMYNTMTGANPTLRPRSRGDVFGMGDVVGQVQIGGRGQPHDVYEKLFVAPKGSDVPGVKLSKKTGGKV